MSARWALPAISARWALPAISACGALMIIPNERGWHSHATDSIGVV
jgi:hypothetical protein